MSEAPDDTAPPEIPPIYIPSFSLLLLVMAALAGIVFYTYGTLSPCGIFRLKVRTQMQKENTVGAMPDDLLELKLHMQYGELKPGACFALLMAGHIKAQALELDPQNRPMPPQKIP